MGYESVYISFLGQQLHRGLYCPEASTHQGVETGVPPVCVQQWAQAEGSGLLQKGNSPGSKLERFYMLRRSASFNNRALLIKAAVLV